MDAVRNDAVTLRRQGLSYNEIHDKLGIPKSTLYGWLREIPVSDVGKLRLEARVYQGSVNGLIKRNKRQTVLAHGRAQENHERGKEQIPILDGGDLLLIGAALYWAEGYKRLKIRGGKEITSHAICFVNADPLMITVFIRYLVESLAVPREHIWASMRLYPQMDEQEMFRYWETVSGLPGSQFRKTTWMVSGASRGIRPADRLPYGTLQVGVNDTAKFHQLLGHIEGVKKMLGVL